MQERPMKGNVLILGGTSDISVALAACFASEGYSVTMAGRDRERLEIIGSDLHIRYRVPVHIVPFDALAFNTHPSFYKSLPVSPDIAVCVFGYLGEQPRAELDWTEAAMIIDSNYTGAVSILSIIANDFESRKHGVIAGISSVAGDRGRQSNYIYGSAKAGFSAYLSGLRNRLFKHHVHVLTVKPGFMKTRMIEGMKTPGPLTASPEKAAAIIYQGIQKRRNVIYVLPVWRLVMLIITLIPETIFKKLKL